MSNTSRSLLRSRNLSWTSTFCQATRTRILSLQATALSLLNPQASCAPAFDVTSYYFLCRIAVYSSQEREFGRNAMTMKGLGSWKDYLRRFGTLDFLGLVKSDCTMYEAHFQWCGSGRCHISSHTALDLKLKNTNEGIIVTHLIRPSLSSSFIYSLKVPP
jgi:hypothetical protein